MRFSVPDGIKLNYSTLAGASYRKSLNVSAQTIELQLLLANRTKKRWLEVGCVRTNISLDLYMSPAGWVQDAEKQLEFLTIQDAETVRFADVLRKEKQAPRNPWRRNSIYLPNLERPHVLSGEKLHSRLYDVHDQHPERPFRSFRDSEPVLAESDEEQGISEIARDERLA